VTIDAEGLGGRLRSHRIEASPGFRSLRVEVFPMTAFPMTEIGGVPVSRLICGTNPFLGYSHFSLARDKWLREYFTVERMVEVISVFTRNGINAVLGPPSRKLADAIRASTERTGRPIHYMATPMADDLDALLTGIDGCVELGARFCYPHTGYTDTHLLPAENRIVGIEEAIARIRSHGMIPGLSTHRPEAIVVADRAGYDVATYIQPYNAQGFLCQVETDWVCRIINEAARPVICIKPLGAARILPPTGLTFVYHTIKPADTVCIGCMSVQEAEEDIAIARQVLERKAVDVELQETRSKHALKR